MPNESSERWRRRLWTDAEKREIVAETQATVASVSVVTRRHHINANLLFNWKQRHEQDGVKDADALAPPAFIPLGMFAAGSDDGHGDG